MKKFKIIISNKKIGKTPKMINAKFRNINYIPNLKDEIEKRTLLKNIELPQSPETENLFKKEIEKDIFMRCKKFKKIKLLKKEDLNDQINNQIIDINLLDYYNNEIAYKKYVKDNMTRYRELCGVKTLSKFFIFTHQLLRRVYGNMRYLQLMKLFKIYTRYKNKGKMGLFELQRTIDCKLSSNLYFTYMITRIKGLQNLVSSKQITIDGRIIFNKNYYCSLNSIILIKLKFLNKIKYAVYENIVINIISNLKNKKNKFMVVDINSILKLTINKLNIAMYSRLHISYNCNKCKFLKREYIINYNFIFKNLLINKFLITNIFNRLNKTCFAFSSQFKKQNYIEIIKINTLYFFFFKKIVKFLNNFNFILSSLELKNINKELFKLINLNFFNKFIIKSRFLKKSDSVLNKQGNFLKNCLFLILLNYISIFFSFENVFFSKMRKLLKLKSYIIEDSFWAEETLLNNIYISGDNTQCSN